jgi:conjugal transfer ATP-binding protein TraC
VDRHGLWLRDHRVSLLSVKRLPTEAVLGGALRYLGNPLSGRRGIREPLLIGATLYFPDAQSSHSRLETARTWLTNQADSGLARFAPVLAARKGEYDLLRAAVDSGNRVVQLDLGVTLFTSDADANAAVTNLQTFYRTGGLQMMPDEFISLLLFLNRLPFGAEPRAVRALQRARTLAVPQVVPLLPVFGDWPGTGTPTLLLVSRQGQLVTLCPFDSPSNYNGVIAAAPGKGKSFLANALISGLLSRGGRVWVLDVGRSYQKMAEALGGQVLAFTPDAQVGLNPFPLVGDWDEEADMIAGLLTAMAAPSEPLENLQAAELKRVLRTVWDQYGRAATVSRVATALLAQPDRRVKDLGRQLYSFTDAGEYGAFFSGPNSLQLDQPFLVVELEELKGRRHLQQVVLLTILYQIQQQLYLNQAERDRPKLVLIDEAWEYLAGGNILDFLVATWCLTENPRNWRKPEEGWSEADSIVFAPNLLKNDGFRFAPPILRVAADHESERTLPRFSVRHYLPAGPQVRRRLLDHHPVVDRSVHQCRRGDHRRELGAQVGTRPESGDGGHVGERGPAGVGTRRLYAATQRAHRAGRLRRSVLRQRRARHRGGAVDRTPL